MFSNPFWFLKKNVHKAAHGEVVENLVVVEEATLSPLFRVWAYHLHRRIAGLSSDRVLIDNVGKFVRKLLHIFKFHGVNNLITRMKVMLFVVNAYLSGSHLKSTHSHGVRIRLAGGLPKLLPVGVRQAIRSRNKVVITIWASLLYVYRALAGRHKMPDLSAVANNFASTSEFEGELKRFTNFCKKYAQWLFRRAHVKPNHGFGTCVTRLSATELRSSSSAGPTPGSL